MRECNETIHINKTVHSPFLDFRNGEEPDEISLPYLRSAGKECRVISPSQPMKSGESMHLTSPLIGKRIAACRPAVAPFPHQIRLPPRSVSGFKIETAPDKLGEV